MSNQEILRGYQKKLREIDATLPKITIPEIRKKVLEFRTDVVMSIMDLQGQIVMQLKQQANGGRII